MKSLKRLISSVLIAIYIFTMNGNTFAINKNQNEIDSYSSNYLEEIDGFSINEDKSIDNDFDYQDYIDVIGNISGESKSSIVNLNNSGYEQDVPDPKFDIHNTLTASITPGKKGFAIVLRNFGIDRVSFVSFTIKIYKYDGTYVASKTITDSNVNIGTTTYTWLIDKSDTVQETVKLSGYAIDGPRYDFGSVTTYRYNFIGGAYGSMQAYEGQRHHIPSNSINGLNIYSGPAIRMLKDDHKKTASYGSSSAAKAFRAKEEQFIKAGRFDKAMQLGIDDIRKLFGSKYDEAIEQMISYAISKGYIKSGTVK